MLLTCAIQPTQSHSGVGHSEVARGALIFLVSLLESFQNRSIGERRDVTERPAFRDVPQQPAHDFP